MTSVALADGIIDSAIMSRQEGARPAAQKSDEAIDWQWRKIKAGLDRFESSTASFGELHMGLITLGCALGYMAVRLPDFPLYDGRPKLKGWFAKVSERPSFQNTAPKMPADGPEVEADRLPRRRRKPAKCPASSRLRPPRGRHLRAVRPAPRDGVSMTSPMVWIASIAGR
jgi:hypothetical protein